MIPASSSEASGGRLAGSSPSGKFSARNRRISASIPRILAEKSLDLRAGCTEVRSRNGMCGIAGTYSRRGEGADRALLLAMAGELQHRGPDGTGLYLDGRLGMVANRLAIVDLVDGDQPLSDEAGRFWVMQNGEVYNYVELREELRALGHRFQTSCDTEVIAHAYQEWGVECLQRLNGDFAIAVWDRDREELFLARDRFGVRPLFLAEYAGDEREARGEDGQDQQDGTDLVPGDLLVQRLDVDGYGAARVVLGHE
jgi:glutamine phosphoribosylpyrophosphate amidotransferase